MSMKKEMNKDLKEIEQRNPTIAVKAGIAALRNKKIEMLKLLEEAINNKELSANELKIYPVFSDYHNDDDFIKLVKDHEKATNK